MGDAKDPTTVYMGIYGHFCILIERKEVILS